MQCGYILLTKTGPSQSAQRKALMGAGVAADAIYVDDRMKGRPKPSQDPLPQRTAAIGRLAENDELVIVSAARLGMSLGDVLSALVAIGERRAAIFDLGTGKTVRWHPDAQEAITFLERAENGHNRELTAKMRAAKEETGVVGGQPAKYSPEQLKEAEQHWKNPDMTAAEAVARSGIPERTLYNHFGKRGTPRFGHLPKATAR